MKKLIWISLIAVLVTGCSSSTVNVGSLVLPTSGRKIDVVQHRSDVKTLDCTTLTVLQTYDASGVLIDAKSAQGRALHCDAAVAVIDAGATVGAANQIRRGLAASASTISNSNEQVQGQEQGQSSVNTNTAQGGYGQGGAGGSGGAGGKGGKGGSGGNSGGPDATHGQHGNNGGGNGSGDGTNPGTGHHHNNGDSN